MNALVHKPLLRMVMTYTANDGKRVATLIKVGTQEADKLVLRTLKWAAHTGVEVTFRPA